MWHEDFQRDGPIVVWVWRGQLTAAAAQPLKSRLAQFLEEDSIKVVVDMSGVDHIDTMGLGLLLVLLRELRLHQGRMILARVGSRLASALNAVYLDRVFEILETTQDAVRLLNLSKTVKVQNPQ